jgi:hypothetical protein
MDLRDEEICALYGQLASFIVLENLNISKNPVFKEDQEMISPDTFCKLFLWLSQKCSSTLKILKIRKLKLKNAYIKPII